MIIFNFDTIINTISVVLIISGLFLLLLLFLYFSCVIVDDWDTIKVKDKIKNINFKANKKSNIVNYFKDKFR